MEVVNEPSAQQKEKSFVQEVEQSVRRLFLVLVALFLVTLLLST